MGSHAEMATPEYPRDLIGYEKNPPNPKWPNNARIAINFVLNYEEGGENCVLHGDEQSETFLSEIIGAQAFPDRHMSMETMYEFGSRAGFWRLRKLLVEKKVPTTVFGVTMAMERNPAAVEAMKEAGWEIATHGLRWVHFQDWKEEDERKYIEESMQLHKKLTGSKPKGWYTGRTSPYTLKLVAERDDLLYCADSYSDDLPYYDENYSNPILIVPYTLDTNDMRFAAPQGFNCGDQFFTYLKDAFDTLYEEGAESPKMLSIGLHCRISGRPARIASLKRFTEYAQRHSGVWLATREEIATHWQNYFPYGKAKKNII